MGPTANLKASTLRCVAGSVVAVQTGNRAGEGEIAEFFAP